MMEVMTMLSDFLAVTTLVVTDIDQAKPFYEKQLGLTLLEETPAVPVRCRQGIATDDPAGADLSQRPDGDALRGR